MDKRPILYHLALFLFLGLALTLAVACKDFEDCRPVYTNVATIQIETGVRSEVKIHRVKFSLPYEHILYDQADSTQANTLKDLKKLPIPLHPKRTSVQLLFFKNRLDPLPDTLTIYYRVQSGMLSPQCGLHQAYVLDSLESSFAEATIIKPTLRTEEYEKGNEEEEKNPNVKIRY